MTRQTEKFPRSTDLPSQSPLFWVEQKDRYLRQLLIRDIEDLTKRRLIVYFANRFENAQDETRRVPTRSLRNVEQARWGQRAPPQASDSPRFSSSALPR